MTYISLMNSITLTSGYCVPGYELNPNPGQLLNTSSAPMGTKCNIDLTKLIPEVQFGNEFLPFGYMNPFRIVNIIPDNSANGGPALPGGFQYPQEQHVPTQQAGYVDYMIYDDLSGLIVPFKIKYIIDNDNLVVDGNLAVLPGGNVYYASSRGWAPRKIKISGQSWDMSFLGDSVMTNYNLGVFTTIEIGNGVDVVPPMVIAFTSNTVFITYE